MEEAKATGSCLIKFLLIDTSIPAVFGYRSFHFGSLVIESIIFSIASTCSDFVCVGKLSENSMICVAINQRLRVA